MRERERKVARAGPGRGRPRASNSPDPPTLGSPFSLNSTVSPHEDSEVSVPRKLETGEERGLAPPLPFSLPFPLWPPSVLPFTLPLLLPPPPQPSPSPSSSLTLLSSMSISGGSPPRASSRPGAWTVVVEERSW